MEHSPKNPRTRGKSHHEKAQGQLKDNTEPQATVNSQWTVDTQANLTVRMIVAQLKNNREPQAMLVVSGQLQRST